MLRDHWVSNYHTSGTGNDLRILCTLPVKMDITVGVIYHTAPSPLTLFYTITVMLSQLNKDIDYCTRVLGCNAEQTDELIGAAEALTVNAEYFCEEFIVAPEGENAMKYQREDFIDLDAFNAYHGIYFEEVE